MEKTIEIAVELDGNQVPSSIRWRATDAPTPEAQECQAFLLSVWDAAAKNTMRIDLWTQEMQVDHMNAFFFQTLMTMAETYSRATGNEEVAQGLRRFAEDFGKHVELPPR